MVQHKVQGHAIVNLRKQRVHRHLRVLAWAQGLALKGCEKAVVLVGLADVLHNWASKNPKKRLTLLPSACDRLRCKKRMLLAQGFLASGSNMRLL